MRSKLISLFFVLLTLSACSPRVREFRLGEGYAATSVNAAVFRAASVTSDSQYQFAAWYAPDGTVMVARRELAPESGWVVQATDLTGNCADAHNVISLGLDGAGYLHVSWAQHGVPLRYARSRTPYRADFEVTGQMVDADLERHVTYPEFRRFSDGDLLFAYRDGSSGNGDLVLNRYDVQQGRWERIQSKLIDGQRQRNAYWQMYMDAQDVIHLSWVWRETWNVETNHDLCYAASRDGGQTWQRSDGTPYALPITLETAEVAWEIPQGSELINQTSMTADPQGHPCIATYWRAQGDSIPQYRLVRHDGRAWSAAQVGARRTPFSLSGGGTKSIPISRPQIVTDGKRTMLIYRDEERGSRVSFAQSRGLRRWRVRDLTQDPVDAWEPSLDYERWKHEGVLDLFVQRVGQGDGEKTVDLPPQTVRILEITPPIR
ncbi:MAG: BNR repeat-containing protein [Bacteroidales bacterium]|nr:BNR repeat-containing protein [Bacteroidales bacterium]